VGGSFSYAVNSTEVVAPSDVRVLRQTTHAELTLVTCYPFRYKGPSPKRFIVHATRITDGDPSELGVFSLVGQ
jgi:sortase A